MSPPRPRQDMGRLVRPVEVVLRYDERLKREPEEMGVCRCAIFKDRVMIEAVVRLGDDRLYLYVPTKNYGGTLPKDRQVPSISQRGSSEWFVEPWQWESHVGLPPGSTMLIQGVPEGVRW